MAFEYADTRASASITVTVLSRGNRIEKLNPLNQYQRVIITLYYTQRVVFPPLSLAAVISPAVMSPKGLNPAVRCTRTFKYTLPWLVRFALIGLQK